MTPQQAYDICIKEKHEPIILQSPQYLYYYARNVIKGRCPEAEPIILRSRHYTCLYAMYVMKRRWPKAEPIIQPNNYYWQEYCNHFGIKQNKCNWKLGL